MEDSSPNLGDLPFSLALVSEPGRKLLKTIAVKIIQYQNDLPAREAKLQKPKKWRKKFCAGEK